MTAANLVSYSAQVLLLVGACAALPRSIGLRAPTLQYVFWRGVLGVCLVLPFVEPWRHEQMVFVPASPAVAGHQGAITGVSPIPLPPAVSGASLAAWAAAVLLVGIAARFAWLSLGVFRLQRMRRRAVERAEGFDDLQQAIGSSASIDWSADVRHPVAFGILRPAVLLPVSLRMADASAQRAVIAHELHHVKRRDWAWVLGEEIVRAIFWFHPAMWWLVSRVQLARETVVDELSILTTNSRRVYLDTLLAFADDSGLDPSPAFSARRHLFHRIMLLSKEGGMSSIRIAASSCALVLAVGAGSWGAVWAFPLHGATVFSAGAVLQDPPRDPRPPAIQRPVSFDFENADLGSVVRLFGEFSRLDVVLETTVNGQVTFHVKDVPWNEALAQILEPHGLTYTITGNTLKVSQRATPQPQTRPTPGQLPPPPSPPARERAMPPPPPPSASQDMPESFRAHIDELHPVRIGANIKMPTKIKDVRPEYPPEARAAGIQGVVIVEVLINDEGNVADQRILRSIPGLDEAALNAVSQWKFVPTELNGIPTAVLMTVTVNFLPE